MLKCLHRGDKYEKAKPDKLAKSMFVNSIECLCGYTCVTKIQWNLINLIGVGCVWQLGGSDTD